MRQAYAAILLSGALLPTLAHAQAPLSLGEAERLISAQDPAIARFSAQAEALETGAVAAGELPDPRLNLGLLNLPTDTFRFDQEPMTQAQVGISQAFPAGNTLSLRSARMREMARQSEASRSAKALDALLAVRLAWLESYYWARAVEVLKESQSLIDNIIGSMASRFATGLKKSEDLIRTELELSLVEDKAVEAVRQLETARAALVRWIGVDGQRPIDESFPNLPSPGAFDSLRAGLVDHPQTTERDAEIAVKRREIALAEQKYWPEFSVGANYGYRDSDRTGRRLPDFASVMVNVSLPLFPAERQDKQVQQAHLEASSARLSRDAQLLEMERMLRAAWSSWQRLQERLDLYDSVLDQQAKANLDASLQGYQTDVTDFPTLMRAQLTEIETRLQRERVRVDRGKAHAQLLYLKGDNR